MDPWEQALWNLLCEIYRQLGGDCADLPKPSLPDAIGTLEAQHAQHGPPQFSGSEAKAHFLDVLNDAEELLQAPESTLSEGDTQRLLTLISNLRSGMTQ